MNENIKKNLTPGANEALNEALIEYENRLLQKSYDIFKTRESSKFEITLSDMLESKEQVETKRGFEYSKTLNNISGRNRLFYALIGISGYLYTSLGIFWYLYQNSVKLSGERLGLIVAATGIILSSIANLLTLQANKRLGLYGSYNNKKQFNLMDENEVVRKWQIVEKLTTKLIKQKERNRIIENLSFREIIDYLYEAPFLNASDKNNLKELLKSRNQIVHQQTALSHKKIVHLIDIANRIIAKLEESF